MLLNKVLKVISAFGLLKLEAKFASRLQGGLIKFCREILTLARKSTWRWHAILYWKRFL